LWQGSQELKISQNMVNFSKLGLLLLSLLSVVAAWNINTTGDRRSCQNPSDNPLEGCAPGTIFVDPVNPLAQFKTVQSGELWLCLFSTDDS
jgi:hypothetical protein